MGVVLRFSQHLADYDGRTLTLTLSRKGAGEGLTSEMLVLAHFEPSLRGNASS
jgi:hypothetical protein